MLLFEELPADSVIAAELHILPGEMVFKVKRLRTIDDTPYARGNFLSARGALARVHPGGG